MKPERIVEVEWEDSASVHGWHKESDDPGTAPCRSVGYVVRDDDDAITLVEGLDESVARDTVDVSRHGCATTIPRSAIRKVRELRRIGK